MTKINLQPKITKVINTKKRLAGVGTSSSYSYCYAQKIKM